MYIERFELRVFLSLNLHVLILKISGLVVVTFGSIAIVELGRSSILLILYLGEPKYSVCEGMPLLK